MYKFIACSILSTFILSTVLTGIPQYSEPQALSDQVREFLRHRIENGGIPFKISVGKDLIHSSVMLPLFYERRTFRPAWSNDSCPLFQLDTLIRAIGEADKEGLRPDDYHLAEIEAKINKVRQNLEKREPLNPRRLADLDLLLTDAFLIYGSHLLAGKVNPESIDAEWFANRREADLAHILEAAINSNQIEEALKSLLPRQTGYNRLKSALSHYREIATKGGWIGVPEGSKMQRGDRGARVLLLRNRLIATGDFTSSKEIDEDLFDEELEQAVRQFQKRHGLAVDGIVGPLTMASLNVPTEERVRQIKLNMERWRWLPQDLGKCYIIVNIANYELDVVENDKTEMSMRVVVGDQYRRTPVFSAKITYLVLNPYWHIPPNIAIKDKLPLIQKNPDYLEKQKIKVFQGWGAEAKEIDPEKIDWAKVSAKNFNFRLRQEPGPMNALGRVKFMFPNKFNVYLHDTPSRELFTKTMRPFSSGCIRIEKPIELAEYLLRDDPRWNRENILSVIYRGIEQTVSLPEPIAAHLLYWTVWADEDGLIQFRNDIYERDKRLDLALREKSPTSAIIH